MSFCIRGFNRPAAAAPAASLFPLSISANGRYLQGANGTPFLIHGDTPWSIAVQLTNAQIDAYLAAMAAVGVNTILFNAPERYFTSQTPTYNNVDGVAPFTAMTDYASALTAYWNRVDHIVNSALALGILCIIEPAYLGYLGGSQGWNSQVTDETAADLQTYGAALANRYTQGNIIWCMGGDYSGTVTERNKQWNIITGIRSVRTTDIITAHSDPEATAWPSWNGYTGWNLNTTYCYPDLGSYPYAQAATEYARAGPIPFFHMESRYEQETGYSDAIGRLQMYTPVLSGALAGFLIGVNPRWHFESPNTIFGYTGTYADSYTSTLTLAVAHAKALFEAYSWWKLEPKTGTELVTTTLSTGDTRICPALASDASFAMVWKPGSGASTVNMAALAPSSIRARFYNPADGTYAAVAGSPFANSGTQSITWPGERVLVLDEG